MRPFQEVVDDAKNSGFLESSECGCSICTTIRRELKEWEAKLTENLEHFMPEGDRNIDRHAIQQIQHLLVSKKIDVKAIIRRMLHSSVHELEETVSSLESERNALNIQNAKLLAACEVAMREFRNMDLGHLIAFDILDDAIESTKPQGAG